MNDTNTTVYEHGSIETLSVASKRDEGDDDGAHKHIKLKAE